MPFIEGVLREEYDRLAETLADYLADPNNSRRDQAIASILEDMDFIKRAFKANNVSLVNKMDIRNITIQQKEALFAEATQEAIAKHHAKGLPTAHGDRSGVYWLYPTGRRVHKLWKRLKINKHKTDVVKKALDKMAAEADDAYKRGEYTTLNKLKKDLF